MIVRAYAKINFGLEVLGKRTDGYHEIISVMQRVALYDELSIDLDDDISFTCDRDDLAGEGNLVLRAARLLREQTATPLGAKIHLSKGTPAAAGLGGGSSDAASTLITLHRLWRTHLSERQLLVLAGALGSDVPFFFSQPTALATGRGELLQPLRSPESLWVILVVPQINIPEKTRHLYGALSPDDYSDGRPTRTIASALDAGQPFDPALSVNAFERIVWRDFPVVRACREAFFATGAPWVRLSGSGPALYTLLPDEATALAMRERLLRSLEPSVATVLLTHTLTSEKRPRAVSRSLIL